MMRRVLSRLAVLFACACGGGDGASNPCAGVDCGAGRCVADGASATCECDPGYVPVGLSCQSGGDSDTDTDGDADTDTDDCVPEDTVGDGVDQNCDGADGIDGDGDRHASLASGGDDCDDSNLEIHPGAEDGDQWSVADAYGSFGTDVSMAVGSDGSAEFAFHQNSDGSIRYATSGGGFNFIAAGEDPSIALDDTDTAYIAFYDSGFLHLFLAFRAGGGWGTREVDGRASGRVGLGPSFAIDGRVGHVVYDIEDTGELEHAWFDVTGGGVTSFEALFTGDAGRSGRHASLALAGGAPHVAFYELGMSDLAYVVAPGAEVRVDETGNTGLSPSIALDSRGHPHVAYYDRDAGQMQYAVEDGGWAVETIDSGANWVSLALDDADAAHVVYQRDAQAWYAQNVDGDWRLQTIEEAAGTGDSTAVAVHDGIVHALYGASGLDRVRYATRPLPDGVDSDCDGVQ